MGNGIGPIMFITFINELVETLAEHIDGKRVNFLLMIQRCMQK